MGVRPGAVSFSLLGPVSATVGGERVTVSGRRQRVILSLLVLARGRVVPVATLVDAVWGERPPLSARARVALGVIALRKAFRAAGHSGTVIVGTRSGYRLSTERAGFDVREFDDLVAAADRAAAHGEALRAGLLYRGALDLWSGPALEGVGGRLTESAAARLEARRRAVCEALLTVGRDLADDGFFDEAEQALRDVLRAAEEPGAAGPAAEAHLALGRLLVTLYRLGQGRHHLRAAAALGEERAVGELAALAERGSGAGEALELVPRQAVR
ncbi:AfsR/SARP family transcriptional regulator [Streptomyces griseocarneus]|uniref:AfsR/SARP family transcriptional regulator n=1 Tax=Streptomyces griseocarneus TaxID=51201 RepID=UPI001CCFC4FE|nr:helix-turn-helix domain-containing protein [Streptomyces griseocarneus]MBZ6474800.1 helix-turn-helix domain-containing protein [Streptomyces griseocarneus]